VNSEEASAVSFFHVIARFSTQKISETIIDFAQPLLVHVDSTTPQRTVRQGFGIAVTIWNALVLDRVNGNSDHRTLMRRKLGEPWEVNPLIKFREGDNVPGGRYSRWVRHGRRTR